MRHRPDLSLPETAACSHLSLLLFTESGMGIERVVLEWAESEWCWNGQRASDVGMGRERVVLEWAESE